MKDIEPRGRYSIPMGADCGGFLTGSLGAGQVTGVRGLFDILRERHGFLAGLDENRID